MLISIQTTYGEVFEGVLRGVRELLTSSPPRLQDFVEIDDHEYGLELIPLDVIEGIDIL